MTKTEKIAQGKALAERAKEQRPDPFSENFRQAIERAVLHGSCPFCGNDIGTDCFEAVKQKQDLKIWDGVKHCQSCREFFIIRMGYIGIEFDGVEDIPF